MAFRFRLFQAAGILVCSLAALAQTASSTPSSQLDWDSVTLTTTWNNGTDQSFTVDDNGNYTSSAPLTSQGRITDSELSALDSRIDAIKEEAFEPLSCSAGGQRGEASQDELSLTFANAPDAIVYQFRPSDQSNNRIGEACPSGDPAATADLLSNLNDLRSRYGCTRSPIWTSDAQSFVFTSVDGLINYSTSNACPNRSTTYEFDANAQTLTVSGCYLPLYTSSRPSRPLSPINSTIQLSSSETAQIVSQLQSIQSTCPRQRCGADAPMENIAIGDAAGNTLATYSSNFYSGECAYRQGAAPPYVPFKDLMALEKLLDQLIAAP
jgi:hypothetical protein